MVKVQSNSSQWRTTRHKYNRHLSATEVQLTTMVEVQLTPVEAARVEKERRHKAGPDPKAAYAPALRTHPKAAYAPALRTDPKLEHGQELEPEWQAHRACARGGMHN